MLDSKIKSQLDSYLGHIAQPIELSLSPGNSDKGQELLSLATEISEMSDRISLRHVSADREPNLGVAPAGEAPRVNFAGIPMGHEFTSLVLALLQAGGHPSKADPALLDQVRALKGEFRFETYISLSCQNCPDVVQALNLMARVNPKIQHSMIDGGLFQDEVEERGVMGVPAVFLNGEPFGQGRMSLADIVGKLDQGASEKQAAQLQEKEPYDVLVVGGGPAGAAAAIYAARKGIRTGLVAERFGGQVADTLGIENMISMPYTEGPKLVSQMEQHVRDYDVDIITDQQAAQIRRRNYIELDLASEATLRSRSVILATGARWRELSVPGEQEYRNKGVAYCPHCDGPFYKGKRVAVVGGGNSGIEAAIDLAGIVEHVTVLEFADTLKADDVLQRKAESLPNVEIIRSAQTTEVVGDGKKVNGLVYTDRRSGESHNLAVAGIFVQIGLIPNSEWLQGSDIALNRYGEVEVDARGGTSMPGVFAAGDVTTEPYKQIVIAMGAGSTAALSAFDHLIRTPDPAAATGTSAVNEPAETAEDEAETA